MAASRLVLVQALQDPVADEVAELADGEYDTDGGGAHHEVGEDFLLGGSGDVAVHDIGAGGHVGALHQARHVEAMPESVQQVEEEELDDELEDEAEQVGPPQASVLLACDNSRSKAGCAGPECPLLHGPGPQPGEMGPGLEAQSLLSVNSLQ